MNIVSICLRMNLVLIVIIKDKGHSEPVCFSKRDDEKWIKMAVKISAVMADKIKASNNEVFESVLNKIERLNLK